MNGKSSTHSDSSSKAGSSSMSKSSCSQNIDVDLDSSFGSLIETPTTQYLLLKLSVIIQEKRWMPEVRMPP